MPGIFHEVEIKASPEMVFLAITDENLLACWWLTGAKIGSGQGAQGFFPLSKDGKEKIIVEILRFDLNQWVTWKCIEHPSKEWLNTEISFELVRNNANDCTLRFRHQGFQDESGSFGAASFQWAAQYLNNLKILLEKK